VGAVLREAVNDYTKLQAAVGCSKAHASKLYRGLQRPSRKLLNRLKIAFPTFRRELQLAWEMDHSPVLARELLACRRFDRPNHPDKEDRL